MSTCKQYRLPLKIVNLNNRYMGMVRQWQEFFHGNRHAESYMDALPDFVKLAESFGHAGMRIERPADLRPMMKEAFSRKKELVFLDIQTDPAENVYPMVAAGKGLSEMVLAGGFVMRRVLSILMENEPGALSRVAGLFSARNYNIESLTVAPTEDPTLSRMTVVTAGGPPM